jgi:hypothetical protein
VTERQGRPKIVDNNMYNNEGKKNTDEFKSQYNEEIRVSVGL